MKTVSGIKTVTGKWSNGTAFVWIALVIRHVGYFRTTRNPSTVDAKRGEYFLQADFSLLICQMPNCLLSSAECLDL